MSRMMHVDACNVKRPSLWRDTAIMITTEEGGGYYDSDPTRQRAARLPTCRAIRLR